MKPLQSIIYGIADPINDQVRYIGKTNDLHTRIGIYESQMKLGSCRNKALGSWLISIVIANRYPVWKILEQCLRLNAHARELDWIQKGIESGWQLFNIVGNKTFVSSDIVVDDPLMALLINPRRLK